MGRPPEFGGFSDIDASGAVDRYARYLDAMRGVEAVAEWKERSLALLEPRPGAVLVDVGCGTGDDARALAERVAPGGRVIGIDASAGMVAEARRRGAGAGAEFATGDAARLPLPGGSADGARCERTLQHVPRPADAIAEMARVVRPGGRVVAAEPDWATLVADPGDPDVCREIARAAVARVRSGAIGRALRGLLLAAGLEEVGVTARTLVVAGAERAGLVFDLDGALAAAVGAGGVTEAQASAWRAGQRAAARDGTGLAAMTAFMAWGRVPVSGH